jgi:hypothetical protein
MIGKQLDTYSPNLCRLKEQLGIFSRKLFFFIVVDISAARRCECMYKNIDALMVTLVWQELEYRIDVCRVTRGVYIEHL